MMTAALALDIPTAEHVIGHATGVSDCNSDDKWQ
jgi:hypothetical protein